MSVYGNCTGTRKGEYDMAAVTWKCPNCGGGLQFDPSSQCFECEYCMSRFTKEELDSLKPEEGEVQPELETETEPGTEAEWGAEPDAEGSRESGGGLDEQREGRRESRQTAVIYTCPSCGAEIVTDETTAATFCFYCHNPIVLQGQLDGTYEPDYVLPFAIEKERAKEIFLDWLKKKKFVPSDFYGPEQIEKLTGVYFPYWLYSCQVDGRLDAEGIRLRTWRTGSMQYTETQKYDISRSGQMKVDNVTRNALKKADKQLAEGVMPFDMKQIKPFSMAFLAGFLAEKRDMEKQEFTQEVETEVEAFAADSLKSSIGGYSSVNVRSQTTRLLDSRWDYALLPVWTLTYKDKKNGKIYYFACNGQTGKICGKLPVDSKKLWIFFLEMFLSLLTVLLIAGYLI